MNQRSLELRKATLRYAMMAGVEIAFVLTLIIVYQTLGVPERAGKGSAEIIARSLILYALPLSAGCGVGLVVAGWCESSYRMAGWRGGIGFMVLLAMGCAITDAVCLWLL